MLIGMLSPYPLIKRLAGLPATVTATISDGNYQRLGLRKKGSQERTVMIRRNGIHQLTLTPDDTGTFDYVLEAQRDPQSAWEDVFDEDGESLVLRLQVDPAWLAQAVFYCVFVRFFKGRTKETVERNPAVERLSGILPDELKSKSINPLKSILPGEGGTFDDVKAHLDVLKSMEINTLYFNPIHLIGELYRGYNMLDQLPSYLQPGSPYSIKDYKSIDPELTYDRDTKKHLLSDPAQEFRDLIEAAHEREMYIVMDLVFNHTAHDFVLQRIRPEWYLYKEHITSLNEPYLYPEDVEKGKPWGDPKHSVPPYDHEVWWEDCAQLNWEYMITPAPNDPPPNDSIDEMWEYFMSIPQYWIRHFGVDGFRCDVAYRVPTEFWRECIRQSRAAARELKTSLSGDVVFLAESYTTHLSELQHAGFAAVYGDYSHKVNKANHLKAYLDHIYNLSGKEFPDGSLWFHFPDSHDFDRSPRKVLGDTISSPKALLANQSRWVLTACLPGVPLIFNGFEKVEWQPINIWSYGAINWEKEEDLREYIALVNSIRHRHPALQKGSYVPLKTNQRMNDDTQLFAFERRFKDERVVVVVNMDVSYAAGPANVYLPDWYEGKSYTLFDELDGSHYERNGRELTVLLDPGESHIFEVRHA